MTAGRLPGCKKSGGRQKGTQNKLAVTEKMRADILSVYCALGGVNFLLSWAEQNPSEFIRQCWARIAPPMPREEAEPANPTTTVNINNMTDLEVARRVAFALELGRQLAEQSQSTVQHDHAKNTGAVLESPPLPPLDYKKPIESYAVPDNYHGQEIITETQNIENYHGSEAEQGRRRKFRKL